MIKDSVKRKEYYKQYYLKHKEINAYHKKLNYWRNKARKISNNECFIISASLNSLKALCN
jgi:hypothetical protein